MPESPTALCFSLAPERVLMLGAFDWWLYLSFNWQATKGYKHIQKMSCLAIPVNAKMLLSRQNRISNDHRATCCMRDSSLQIALHDRATSSRCRAANRAAYQRAAAAGNPAHRGANMQPLPPLETQKGSQCNHVRRRFWGPFGAFGGRPNKRAPPPRFFFWRMHHLLKQHQILHPSDTTIAIPQRTPTC